MLAAILHSKAGRILADGTKISWRELFCQREDLLSAAFFGRFLHFSAKKRTDALTLLVGADAAATLGEMENIRFWPDLLPHKDSPNSVRVEPDIIIECQYGLVMVEVKYGSGQQYASQWRNEILSLQHTIMHSQDYLKFQKNTLIHFVALGNNSILCPRSFSDLADSKKFHIFCHQKEWTDVVTEFYGWPPPKELNDRAILEEWAAIFTLFGIQKRIVPLDKLVQLPDLEEDSLVLLAK